MVVAEIMNHIIIGGGTVAIYLEYQLGNSWAK